MKIVRGLESVQYTGIVLTIGNFDGVHRGHQAILTAGRRHADAGRTQLVAMTFDPHPATILTPDRIPATLTTFDEKMHHLQQCGVDTAVIVNSRPEFFHITADAFIRDIILERFRPTAMVEGRSFRFGEHRQGDVEMLQAAAQRHGFALEVVEPIRVALGGHPDTVISSSLVRHLLTSGTVDQAAHCLGRPYALIGQVVHGVGRGKELGFPTANLKVGSQLIPADGVYAGVAEIQNRRYTAAISIGHNITFDDGELAVEAHLLDFSSSLYDQTIRLEFLDWLRPQLKFDSPQALIEQMNRDVQQTRAIVAAES